MLDALDVTETVPVLEVIDAPVFVIAPEPEIVMLPLALRAPVGATVVPPEIESVPPFAAMAPAPEYPAVCEIDTDVAAVTFFASAIVLPVDASVTEDPLDVIVPLVAFDTAPEPR
jgi:hypothetical protein